MEMKLQCLMEVLVDTADGTPLNNITESIVEYTNGAMKIFEETLPDLPGFFVDAMNVAMSCFDETDFFFKRQ